MHASRVAHLNDLQNRMSQELASWPRPSYADDGRPFLFFAVFGASTDGLEVSRSRHRCAGVPAGLDLSAYDAQQHADWLDSLRSGYLWEKLQHDDPELARITAGATTCVVLRGEPTDDVTLDYLRDTVGLIQAFFDNGAACLYDPQQLRWWGADEWRKGVFEAAKPVPHRHVVKLVSPMEDGTLWLHTRGMRLFGRPDLSMHAVTPETQPAVVEMFDRLIDLQSAGGVVAHAQPIRMAGMPDGLACFHGGDVDDPEFNNVHIEIGRPAT